MYLLRKKLRPSLEQFTQCLVKSELKTSKEPAAIMDRDLVTFLTT